MSISLGSTFLPEIVARLNQRVVDTEEKVKLR